MSDLKDKIPQILSNAKYMQLNRRSFLKGAMAVGSALALAGCGDNSGEVKTVTVTNTVTVTESAPGVAAPGEVPNMITVRSQIMPQYYRCSGCKICMYECAIYHFGSCRIADSNIWVYCHDLHRGTVDIPILCTQCEDAPCMAACPDKVAAITKDEFSGCIRIDHDKCTLCGLCIDACKENRTGCLRFSLDEQSVVGACDFCDLNPSCVKNCPEDCLVLNSWGTDGRYWAANSYQLAEPVYNMIFGDYYLDRPSN